MSSNHPTWWTTEHDSGWERTKSAFRRDWEQTKHDMGSKSAPNLHHSAADTVKQATASDDFGQEFSRHEPAFKYGYGAQKQFHGQEWNDTLESTLRKDYHGDWSADRDNVQHAFDYASKSNRTM